jgi:hypothetical protein
MSRMLMSVLLSMIGIFGGDLLRAADEVILRGRVMDRNGRAVPAAEVRLSDSQGRVLAREFSDLKGQYRFSQLPTAAVAAHTISATHARFRPIQREQVPAGATSQRAAGLSAGQSAALESLQVISKDLRFSAQSGTKVDPNVAEYHYQQALLLLGREEKKKAVELLKLYAQTGANPKQVARALALIAQHDR